MNPAMQKDERISSHCWLPSKQVSCCWWRTSAVTTKIWIWLQMSPSQVQPSSRSLTHKSQTNYSPNSAVQTEAPHQKPSYPSSLLRLWRPSTVGLNCFPGDSSLLSYLFSATFLLAISPAFSRPTLNCWRAEFTLHHPSAAQHPEGTGSLESATSFQDCSSARWTLSHTAFSTAAMQTVKTGESQPHRFLPLPTK